MRVSRERAEGVELAASGRRSGTARPTGSPPPRRARRRARANTRRPGRAPAGDASRSSPAAAARRRRRSRCVHRRSDRYSPLAADTPTLKLAVGVKPTRPEICLPPLSSSVCGDDSVPIVTATPASTLPPSHCAETPVSQRRADDQRQPLRADRGGGARIAHRPAAAAIEEQLAPARRRLGPHRGRVAVGERQADERVHLAVVAAGEGAEDRRDASGQDRERLVRRRLHAQVERIRVDDVAVARVRARVRAARPRPPPGRRTRCGRWRGCRPRSTWSAR